MLSSKNESKVEDRLAARIDLIAERLDTLASTVATTASAIAKKDGEIAALQRALEARDQTLQTLVQHVNRAAQTPAADVPIDATELRSLRNAVAALTKDRAEGVGTQTVDALAASVRTLEQRVTALAAAAAAAAEAPVTDPATTERIEALAAELTAVRAAAGRPSEEVVTTLATLRGQVDGLAALQARTQDELDKRVGAADQDLARQSDRVDAFGETLAELERTRQATDQRFERHVGESEAALEVSAQRLDALATRLDGLETSQADQEQLVRRFGETEEALSALAQRVDALASRVGSGMTSLADKEQRLQALQVKVAESSTQIDAIAEELRNTSAHVKEQVDERLGETKAVLEGLVQRTDELATQLESATTSHADEEERLEALNSEVSASSTRIEAIADDLREALGAFSVTTPDQLGELSTRIGMVEERLATVAVEVARAKTLWPVALRSLEARLDDVAPQRPDGPDAVDSSHNDRAHDSRDSAGGLLAGLRDSLQAMESVSAQLESTTDAAPEEGPETPTSSPPRAVVGGAPIVPLRTSDP